MSKGENPRDHDVRKELDRLKEHMKRLKDLTSGENSSKPSDPEPNMRVDKQAAQRIVKHSIGRQAESQEDKDPPAKRLKRN